MWMTERVIAKSNGFLLNKTEISSPIPSMSIELLTVEKNINFEKLKKPAS